MSVDVGEPSVFDVVARHGHLTVEKLGQLSGQELAAIEHFIEIDRPDLHKQLAAAMAGGDELEFWGLLIPEMCGWINFRFDQESTARLHKLPEQEREAFHGKPVNTETWRRLRARSRWHMAHPHQHRRHTAAPRHGRYGRQSRHGRRRSVRTGPRRARAPGRLGDDDPEPEHVGRCPAGVAA
jgi:hypothetical protein